MQTEEPPAARRHVLVQATVPPLDEDGRVAGVVGTLVFAVAILVITVRDNSVPAGTVEVPLWIAMCGLGLGLLLLGYCELRIWRRQGRDVSPAGVAEQSGPDEVPPTVG